jgi:hypothetical protein
MTVIMLSGLHLAAQTWSQLSPNGTTPPGRDYFSTAYNPANNRMIVFGGQLNYQSAPTLANDVWVLTNADGTTGTTGWTQLSPGGTPPTARSMNSAVYDSTANRLIIFGGNPSVGYCFGDLNDTWVLTNADGTTGTPGWTQLSPTGGPPSGRARNAAVLDTANNRMIIFGGAQECSSLSNDVWVLSNANGTGGTPAWTQLSPTGTPPAARVTSIAAYDPVNNLMIIFGGGTSTILTNDVWVLSNANGLGGTPVWTQETVSGSTPPRSTTTAAYDITNDTLTVFGGDAPGETNDVWQLSYANNIGGTPTWTRINPSGSAPSNREGQGGIYNPAAHDLVIYGGLNCASSCVTLSDVWNLNLSTATAPTVTTLLPTQYMGTSVTLNAIVNPNSASTTARFELAINSGSFSPKPPPFSLGSGSSPVVVTQAITGLTASVRYRYYLTALNSAGSVNGAIVAFGPPAASTAGASPVAATSAILNGNVIPWGTNTSYYFEWGTDTNYGNTTPVSVLPGVLAGTFTGTAVSNVITGLQPGATYHYQLVATNLYGITTNINGFDFGNDTNFTTATVPSISSFNPTNGMTGTNVIITGNNFTNVLSVLFNGTNALFTNNSISQITATVPTNATTGPISVITSGGTAVSSSAFIVIYAPIITGFTPVGGAGAVLTITGTNFSAATNVIINGSSALFTIISDNQLTATVPSCAGTGPIAVADAAETTLSTTNFTFVLESVAIATTNEANLVGAFCNGSNITFSAGGTIVLTNQLVISSSITLDGSGQNVIISGNNSVGIFYVDPGVHLTLKNLTLANGYMANSGGAIDNAGGIVSLNNCTFTNNLVGIASSATNAAGGAIYNTGFLSLLTINNSTFVNNRAIGEYGNTGAYTNSEYSPGGPGGAGGPGFGGAIDNDGDGTILITNCTFYGNTASGGTGGTGGTGYEGYYYDDVCNSYCCDSGFFGCEEYCPVYCSGYVYGGPGGPGGNGGNGYGGNIYNNVGNVTVINTTFANGSALAGTGGSPGVVGNYFQGSYTPVYGYSGGYSGGNISHVSGQFVFRNSIVANATQGGNFSGNSIVDGGNNLSSDATMAFTNPGSFTNTNPNLGSLTNNGGTTLTLALLPGSPAVRAGSINGAPLLDQRGLPRKSLQIDLGAFETQIVTSTVPPNVSGILFSSANSPSGIGPFNVSFTNLPGTSFSIWDVTNLTAPVWNFLGYAQETSAGQFQFSDTTTTNRAQTFYRIRSP